MVAQSMTLLTRLLLEIALLTLWKMPLEQQGIIGIMFIVLLFQKMFRQSALVLFLA